jgi:hypothetical protein
MTCQRVGTGTGTRLRPAERCVEYREPLGYGRVYVVVPS